MGLTCAAGHIFIGDSSRLQNKANAIDLFDVAVKTMGYEKVERTQSSECELVTFTTDSWVSFFDPGSPGVITAEFAETARAASLALKCPVMVTSVYDSDEFTWLMFHRGKAYDGYSSSDDLLPIRVGSSYPKKQAERWSKLFSTAISADEIKQLIRPSDVYADDRIVELCQLIGLPIENSLLSNNLLDDSWAASAGYRKVDSPTDSDKNDERPLAEPAAAKKIPLIVGQLKTVSYEISVSGRELSNPELLITGSSIEQKRIEVTQAGGIWHGGLADVRKGGARIFQGELTRLNDGGTIRVTSPELNLAAFQPMSDAKITLSYWVNFLALSEGNGDLNCQLTTQDGDSHRRNRVSQYQIAIREPSWKPLRGVKTDVIEQDGFRMLNTPKVISAVIIHEDQGDLSMTSLQDIFEHWITAPDWIASDQVAAIYEGQMKQDSFHVPKRKTLFQMDDVGTAKKWANLFNRSGALQSLFLNRCNELGEPVGGVVVQRPCEDERPSGPGTIHTAFWVAADEEIVGAERATRERQKLASLIDTHFESLGGLQAWVGHWDWIPRFGMAEENNYTPYEEAVGTGSVSVEDYPGSFMRAAWCLNFLRAVSEQVWLNESLRSNIDLQLLSRVATTTDIGAGSVRIDLLPAQQLDRLEEALLPILSK